MKNGWRIFIIFAVAMLTGINIACTKAARVTDTLTDTTNNMTPPDSTVSPPADSTPPADTAHAHYLALGDSYTIGQSVPEDERFPAQAVAVLLKDGIQLGQPQYIATTGWTTVNLQNAITAQNPQGPFEAVTLLIGVNDQYQHVNIADYPGHFTQLLQKAISLAGSRPERVFVLSIPDYSVTPFGGGDTTIRNEIDQYNAINKSITLSYNVAYIDITPASRLAATDPSLIANDGLHPSGKQYALWVQKLAPVMEKALK
ncbi:MAG TPA: SGNH/GDSL hydrolase family protein [Chitinophagaceae bacterium]|nr:SGNH/GDSL hydrolase family protein [Chitinophagaceae bacterium]